MTTRDQIVKLKEAGLGPAAIGRALGISRQRAWQIINGKPKPNVKKPALRYTLMLTIGDVAQYLGVHPNTARRWSEKGILKSYRIGPRRDRRFRREEIDDFLKE
jgi:excisionase family DNA binding protein